jgi:hypothetical protein
MGVGSFLWGALSDRFGTRAVMLCGGILLGIGLMTASQAATLGQFQILFGGDRRRSHGKSLRPHHGHDHPVVHRAAQSGRRPRVGGDWPRLVDGGAARALDDHQLRLARGHVHRGRAHVAPHHSRLAPRPRAAGCGGRRSRRHRWRRRP